MAMKCWVIRRGLCEYREALAMQKQLLERRKKKQIPDTLTILQHPPVITIGRRGSQGNVLADSELLIREGIQVCASDRGGDVTYHGPGQLVCYPVLDLKQHGGDVLRAIYMYEEVIIRLVAGYGLDGSRMSGYPGVWVGGEKVCAVGIGVSGWVSYHGFALNVNTNLNHFSYIIPCGIQGRGVISLSRLLGRQVDEYCVEENIIDIFGQVFDLEMKACWENITS